MGWADAIADPGRGDRRTDGAQPGRRPGSGTRRLQLAIDANVADGYAMANGMGNIDADRMANAHRADDADLRVPDRADDMRCTSPTPTCPRPKC
jgi:hypothetical protein